MTKPMCSDCGVRPSAHSHRQCPPCRWIRTKANKARKKEGYVKPKPAVRPAIPRPNVVPGLERLLTGAGRAVMSR